MNDDSHDNLVGNIILKDIYVIKNTVNNMVYVGQAKDTYKRWKGHKTAGKTGHYKGKSVLYEAMQKIGVDKFYYEIIEKQISNYNDREKYWIKQYNSLYPNGYNLTEGGEQYPNRTGINNATAAIKDEEKLNNVINEIINSRKHLTEIAKEYDIPINTVHSINYGYTYFNDKLDYPLRKEKVSKKLSNNDVEEIIIMLVDNSHSIKEIASRFSVSEETINCINIGATHKDVFPDVKRPFRKGANPKLRSITEYQLNEIIDLIRNTSLSYREIARRYDVDSRVILNIKNGTGIYRRELLKYPLRPNN